MFQSDFDKGEGDGNFWVRASMGRGMQWGIFFYLFYNSLIGTTRPDKHSRVIQVYPVKSDAIVQARLVR